MLVGADVVLAANVQRSLVDQIDQRLDGAINFTRAGSAGAIPDRSREATATRTRAPARRTTRPTPGCPEFFIARLADDGSVEAEQPGNLRVGDPAPKIDPARAVARAVSADQRLKPYTVGADDGSSLRFRMAVQENPFGGYNVAAIPMREADATLSRLIGVEIASTAAALVVLGLVAFWVIRLGLRPIDRMTATADAIAEGDLSRRVEVGPTSTEAGRLGLALNGMLHQIEGAFDERQASEDRLRRFIADASHELRTPLTSIRGYTELYRSGAVSEGAGLADAMRRIEGESVRMGELVDDMLLLARLDQGRPLDADPVDVAALARDSVSDARAVEPERPIALRVPDGPVIVAGDEQRLRQLMANLLANARQHTTPDTPVEVSVAAVGRRQAVIEVADFGPGHRCRGCPTDLRAVLPGRSVAGAAQRSDGGAGLGLSIVAAVAAAHHGQASVETAPGHGARFRIELPLAAPSPRPRRARPPLPPDPRRRPGHAEPEDPGEVLMGFTQTPHVRWRGWESWLDPPRSRSTSDPTAGPTVGSTARSASRSLLSRRALLGAGAVGATAWTVNRSTGLLGWLSGIDPADASSSSSASSALDRAGSRRVDPSTTSSDRGGGHGGRRHLRPRWSRRASRPSWCSRRRRPRPPSAGCSCDRPTDQRTTAIVLVHGGGATGGSQADCASWSDWYRDHGYLTFSIDYRLVDPAIDHGIYPIPEQNTKAAVQYLRMHADELGIDRIVVQGHSAGARLGGILATTSDLPAFSGREVWPDVSDRIDGLIGFYGYYDGIQYEPVAYYGGSGVAPSTAVSTRRAAR